MPHSSGGGSHGGGYHSSSSSSYSSSSSSYSSSSYSSSSYSSGSSYSFNSNPVSRTRYPGATRYVYRSPVTQRESVYYLKGTPDKPDLGVTIISIIIFSVIAIILAGACIGLGFNIPEPLDLNSYKSELLILDDAALLSPEDEALLMTRMNIFQMKTGVTPALEVVYDSTWEGYYTDLETFAFSEYLRLFDDEKHWLFVFSYPEDFAAAAFIDWKWEGMAGDDISPAVNSASEEKFTEIIHKHLLRSEPESLGKQLAEAFSEYSQTVMDRDISFFAVFFLVIVGAAWCFIVFLYVQDYSKWYRISKSVIRSSDSKKDKSGKAGGKQNQAQNGKRRQPKTPSGGNSTAAPAVPTTPDASAVPAAPVHHSPVACEYCGCVYTPGKVTYCPGCGAPVPPPK